ncbi:MAG TPA: thiamine pyrophosphate-binding protein, partial [Dehalococcoidia bacterium]|nr:thiamine pyrophosphate-binding protein [Dehalococcoidia bacterium]
LDPVVDERFAHCPPFRPEPDAASVAEAARLLEGADRPVLIIGGGARTSGADLEVLELAERLAIPFATSLNGKSVVPGDHPLNVGVVGNYSRESANRTVLAAGLVFFVGSRTGSQATASWQVPRPGTRVIQLDINPNELGRHYPNQVEIAGDAKVSVQHLLAVADSSSADRRGEWVQCAQGFVAEWRDRYHSLITSEATPIRPERICGELTGHLPPDAILVADTGHAGMWTGGMVDLIHSGQDYLRAAGSLGWGLPAAIGAKMAQPDRPVLLFTGDGGLYYHLAELETAARWGVNVVILVNDNGSLNQEIHPYSESYGGQLHGRHEELWHFRAIDLAAVAESLGVTGIRVERPGDLRPALERAFSADGPVLLDVVTDIEALAPLALTSP